MILTLQGHTPSKKNRYRYTARGGYVPKDVAADLASLEVQARSQWKRAPLESAVVAAKFYVRNGVSDVDNKYVAISDVLVKAGVIRDDNIKRVKKISAEAVIIKDGDEYCVITVEPVGVAA